MLRKNIMRMTMLTPKKWWWGQTSICLGVFWRLLCCHGGEVESGHLLLTNLLVRQISVLREFNIFGGYHIFSVYRTRGQKIPQWSSSYCQIRVFLLASANMAFQRIWTIILEERKVDCLVSAELNCVERRFQRVLSISRKSGWQQVWSTEEGIIISNNANASNFWITYNTAILYRAQKRWL